MKKCGVHIWAFCRYKTCNNSTDLAPTLCQMYWVINTGNFRSISISTSYIYTYSKRCVFQFESCVLLATGFSSQKISPPSHFSQTFNQTFTKWHAGQKLMRHLPIWRSIRGGSIWNSTWFGQRWAVRTSTVKHPPTPLRFPIASQGERIVISRTDCGWRFTAGQCSRRQVSSPGKVWLCTPKRVKVAEQGRMPFAKDAYW